MMSHSNMASHLELLPELTVDKTWDLEMSLREFNGLHWVLGSSLVRQATKVWLDSPSLGLQINT